MVQPGAFRPLAHLTGGGGEPAHHPGLAEGIGGQPLAIPLPGRQIEEDRLGVAKDGAVLLQDGHLAEGIERQEGLPLVFAGHQIDTNPGVGDAEQLEQQAHLVAVAGEFVAVELDHGRQGWGSRGATSASRQTGLPNSR